MIERPRQRNDPANADAAISGLESGDAAHRRRSANGASRVRAQCREAIERRDTGRRSAGRSAGNEPKIPRIPNGSKIADRRCRPGGEDVHVALADNHSAGREKPARDLGIGRGNVAGERLAARCGSGAGGVDIILEADGNSVQRSPKLAGRLLLFEYLRLLQSQVAHHGDPGIRLRIIRFDARQAGFG